MANRSLFGKTRTINPEKDAQTRLQRNISAQAHAARLEADRKDLAEARARMLALEQRMCLADAQVLDGVIDNMFALVEKCQREHQCPDLGDIVHIESVLGV